MPIVSDGTSLKLITMVTSIIIRSFVIRELSTRGVCTEKIVKTPTDKTVLKC